MFVPKRQERRKEGMPLRHVWKFEFADKKYRIVAPEKVEDIMYEGQALRHCADSSDIYYERIQNRESYIMFLRKAEEPDKP